MHKHFKWLGHVIKREQKLHHKESPELETRKGKEVQRDTEKHGGET
jgi:hypothetical protein